jgi:ammonia channel protein AmtB
VIVVFTVPLLDKLKIDDVVGAIPVHLLAGIWGTLVVPLSNSDATFGTQIIGIVIVRRTSWSSRHRLVHPEGHHRYGRAGDPGRPKKKR